jgi:hypothetical protein
MSEQERFLLTFDSAQGGPVKVERIGEAGELTELDLAGFLRRLTPAPATGAPQQIVINIYGAGVQGPEVVEQLGHTANPKVGTNPISSYYKKKD